VITGAVALYAIVLGAAMLAVRLAGDTTSVVWLVFVVAAAAVVAVTCLLFVPRIRHLRAAIAAARAMAGGRFDTRLPLADDEYGALASALNSAAQYAGATIYELAEQRAQLQALLNASSDATVAVDGRGRIVYLNEAAGSLFGAEMAPAIGRPFIEVVRDHDLNELVAAAGARGERSVLVVPVGPAQRWLQATAVPIERAGAWAALVVFHDLTEVRRLDSVRRDFISNVSHELRTPLAGIRAAAETLQEGALEDRPAAEQFLRHIQRETDRMTQLVEELLDLSRIESGAAPMTFAPLDAAALASETVRRFARQAERAGLHLTALPAGPVTLIGDAERLERALGNLVANAIKFTPQGGEITVSVHESGHDVAIAVADTGVGVEPEEQARVFERFYKSGRGRGAGGTGLGLAIVKHIALAHEGDVSLESRPGRGSTFTIRLPRR